MGAPISVLIPTEEDFLSIDSDVLKISDRCDNGDCGAQAFVRITNTLNGLPVDFCGHHFAKHQESILAQGVWQVQDFRERINARPSASSGTAADDADYED